MSRFYQGRAMDRDHGRLDRMLFWLSSVAILVIYGRIVYALWLMP